MTTTWRADVTTMAYARADDLLPMVSTVIDPTPLLHRWRNTDSSTQGISEIRCRLADGVLYVGVSAPGDDGPYVWNDVPAVLYSDLCSTGGGRGTADPVDESGQPTPHYGDFSIMDSGPAFAATFDHGFQRVHLQARINLGLLVVAMFTEFTDDSGRSNYFVRDCFYR